MSDHFPPIPDDEARRWLINIQVGERESSARADSWLVARATLAKAVAAMFKAGLLSEPDTKFVLEALTTAANPKGNTGAWIAVKNEPVFWRFFIHSPLGVPIGERLYSGE